MHRQGFAGRPLGRLGIPGTVARLLVAFDLRTSSTASRWFRLDYTTDGTTWLPGTPTLLGTPGTSAGDTWHSPAPTAVTHLAALDTLSFGFRIVSVFSPSAFTQVSGNSSFGANSAYEVARNGQAGTSSAYGPTGTWRLDNVTLSAVPEPSTVGLAAAGLGQAGLAARRLLRMA